MASVSTISAGTVVRGSIRGEGDLDIHGRVEGSVELGGELLIAETALIRSDVRARRVTVRGAVAGNISADEAILLEPGARVVGDLGAPQIGIRPGALVRGNVSTGAPLPATAPVAAAAAGRGRPAAAPVARQAPAPRAVAPAPARPAPRPVAPPPVRPAPPPRVVAPRIEAPRVVEAPRPSEPEAAPAAEDEALSFGADDNGGPPPP